MSVFADLKQQYGAGNCHLLQINSKRAGQANAESDGTTNMPDPWRLYVKQSSSTTQQLSSMPRKDSAMSDSLSNLTELIDQELNLNSMNTFRQSWSDRVSFVSSVYVASTESIGYIEQWCNVNRDWRRLRRFINCQYRIGDSWCLLDLEWSRSHPCIHVSDASCWSWCTTSCPFSVID